MKKISVHLRPMVTKVNLPTVLKSATLPGDFMERLFIATQIGEIYHIANGVIDTFLDIRSRILTLGASSGGYDERGLLGLAFHPDFHHNGLFYLHYSVAGTQGPGISPGLTKHDPCDLNSLSTRWNNREVQYDHIDTVEEWRFQPKERPQKTRTLLSIRRPFSNHNGVNSLNFSPETGNLVLTTGDGGSGYDPFNLAQDDMEIAGKIIEIAVDKDRTIDNTLVVTRFHELPLPIQETLTLMAKGVRNIPGISFQKVNNQYIKYVGIVGQDLVESVYSFISHIPIPIPQLVQASLAKMVSNQEGRINFGWRGWEGALPTSLLRRCPTSPDLDEKVIAYYNEAVESYLYRLSPLTCYFHQDPRSDKFGGTALTGVQSYLGSDIGDLSGSVVFTDLARNEGSRPPVRGVLAYSKRRPDCRPSDFSVIETNYDFGAQSAYYVSLGTNQEQTRLYLGVYGSMKVADYNQGTIFEIVQ